MKKQVVLLLLLLVSSCIFADFRSADEALRIANSRDNMRRLGMSATNTKPFRLKYVRQQMDQQTPAFYVLQRDSAAGFMLVSAETSSETILGYSETGRLDLDNAPANVQYWMDRYAKQISRLAQSKDAKAHKLTHTYTPVAPLIGTTWSQGYPFNLLCPRVGESYTVSGCVATAVAQIMYYHKCPIKGTGSHSYTWNEQTLSADFGNTTYDWANMLKKYTYSATYNQMNAVATLVYHVGVAGEMQYSVGGSGASDQKTMQALTQYFGYDKSIRDWHVDYAGAELVQEQIVRDLQDSLPVFICGYTKESEGHAYVCEGLDDKGYLYINWGWGGTADGYFALQLMDPENQGTGGSSGDLAFTESITAYTGIQPNKGGKGVPSVLVYRATLFSANRIAKSTRTGFTLSYVGNFGVADINSKMYLVISDQKGNIVDYAASDYEYTIYPTYWLTDNIYATGVFDKLAAGDYTMSVCVTDVDSKPYPVQVYGLGELIIPIQVTKDSIFIQMEQPEVATELEEFSMAQLSNVYQTNQWEFIIWSPLFFSTLSLGNDQYMGGNLASTSAQSVIGSYVSETNAMPGTILRDSTSYAVGCFYNGYSESIPALMHMTLAKDVDGQLNVDYFMQLNDQLKVGSFLIDSNYLAWCYTYEGKYFLHDSYHMELASPLSVSTARAIASVYADSTYIPYLIQGVVASDVSIEDGKLSFAISEDGALKNRIEVHDFLWLNKTEATGGSGLYKGDTVVIYARLGLRSYQISTLDGYVYAHKPGSSIGTNLEAPYQEDTIYKVLHKGRLIIIRSGKAYDVSGLAL